MYLKQIFNCLLLTLVLSCSYQGNKAKSVSPNEFQLTLASYYHNYSKRAAEHYNWYSWKIFKHKATQLEKGQSILPEDVISKNLPGESVTELSNARLALTSLLSKTQDTIQINPADTAACQFYFDCWLQQQEQNWPVNDANYCRSSFYNSIKTLLFRIDAEKEFVNYVNDIHSIYFKFDSDEIEETSLLSMKKLISELRKVNTSLNIVLYGYTDRIGERKFNKNLAQHRIDAVKKILLNSGAISNDNITTKAFGKQDQLIDTNTPPNNPHSRRVDVFLYKK